MIFVFLMPYPARASLCQSRFLIEHDHSFGPDEIAKLVKGFEAALDALGLARRSDWPLTGGTSLITDSNALASEQPRASPAGIDRCQAPSSDLRG